MPGSQTPRGGLGPADVRPTLTRTPVQTAGTFHHLLKGRCPNRVQILVLDYPSCRPRSLKLSAAPEAGNAAEAGTEARRENSAFSKPLRPGAVRLRKEPSGPSLG